MLKPLFGLAAAGAIGLLLWKLLGVILLPFLGLALGVMFTVIKFLIIFALFMFVLWLVRRSNRRTA